MDDEYPGAIGWLTGFIVFFASWAYCIAAYGYLFGVGLGWLPSFIVAVLAAYLWPLIFLICVLGALALLK